MKGKFIVIEGLEGAGKSSAIQLCQQTIEKHGVSIINTREPGGTPMAEEIRNVVKGHWQEEVTAETELFLMYAARRQLLVNKILPALAQGTWVLADRHDLSTLAYQGGGRQISMDIIKPIRDVALSGIKPDLTIYLDVEPEIGLERARGRGELDRIETAGLAFFHRTREKYLELANKDDSIRIVSAMQSMDEVQQNILNHIEALF